MKKVIKNIMLVLALAAVSVSCRDSIDIVQEGEFSNDATFLSVTDMQKYLNGAVYSSVNNTNEIKLTSVFTDEVGFGSANSGQDENIHRFYLDTTDDYTAGIWQTHYATINRVNRLLEGAAKITPAAADLATYKSIIAQARALRAYAYLQLETFFSTDMKNDDALGVVLLNHVPTINETLPRVKNSIIYTEMEADLNYAETNLGATPSYLYVTKASIAAIRARFYLYRGKNVLAKQYAQSAITLSGLSLTPATPVPALPAVMPLTGVVNAAATSWHNSVNSSASTNSYKRMWNDAAQGEVIFGLSRPESGTWGNIASLYTTNTTNITGSPLFDMGRNLFEKYTTNDIRKYTFVDATSKINPNYMTAADFITSDVIVIDKYPGKGTQPLRNNIKLFRISEMYFILAECAVMENNLPAAAGYIKNIRDARYFNITAALPTYGSAAAAYADILLERRLELCFEGHRYIDLKRLGAVAGVSIDRNATDDRIKTLPTTLPITDYRFTLPIPLDEIQGNPTIQQNPGYN